MNEAVPVPDEHAQVAHRDAAYVLGALTPADRRRFEAHLADCPRCRTAVTAVSGLPGLLSAVPQADVPGDEPPGLPAEPLPATVLPRLVAEVIRRRRRRTWTAVVAGLAAAAVLAAVLTLSWPRQPGPAAAPTRPPAGGVELALHDVGPRTPLTANVTLVAQPWGTRIDVTCGWKAAPPGTAGAPRSYSYILFVTDRAGAVLPAGSWTYGPGTTVEPVGGTEVALGDITAVDVRAPDGTVLLRQTR